MKLVAGLMLLLTSSAIAQSRTTPLVFSPAFDPNCYQPQLGTPGEFDTFHVRGRNAAPDNVYNLGPGPGESYGRIMMTGLPTDPPFETVISTGPGFDLKNLNIVKDLHFHIDRPERLAHLHTSTSEDILVALGGASFYHRIYWQTPDGWYDSTLYTDLTLYGDWRSSAYCAHLTSDTVDDVVAIADSPEADSIFLVFYRGGESLYKQGLKAHPDSTLVLSGVHGGLIPYIRNFFQGDYRGVGRADVIAPQIRGPYAAFYYRNDPPFSMKKFADAMLYDTLLTQWENHYNASGWEEGHPLSFPALPKAPWDRSDDFLVPFSNSDQTLTGSIHIFRGGPTFGSKRLYADSAAVVITNPVHIDGSLMNFRSFGASIHNRGDMTGTGRPVISTVMGSGFSGVNFYYVLGDAADSLIDIYYPNDYGFSADSLTADGDSREDVFIANPTLSQLALLHGSLKIPHRVNPKLALTGVNHSSIPSIIPFPNPAARALRFSLTTDAGESVSVSLRDMLGREVQSWQLAIASGEQIVDLPLESEPSGEYFATISGPHLSRTARVTIIR